MQLLIILTSEQVQHDSSMTVTKPEIVHELTTSAGSSENVNYAMHCMCALLVELGVFDDVFANRLPVG
jgi:hypothetical protein